MADPSKYDVMMLEYIDMVTTSLKNMIEHHQSVMRKYINNGKGDGKDINYCCLVDCPRKQILCETLHNTINMLEMTKKHFKSKELETLRKNLEEVFHEVK